MARLTLRIPDSLHATLSKQAEREGVSMNQFVVYALSRITAADLVAEQRATYQAMLHRYPRDEAEEELRQVLTERNKAKD
jgi:uncharacterized protein (DUF1778 family)